MAIEVLNGRGKVIDLLQTWNCGLCGRLFLDGDLYDKTLVGSIYGPNEPQPPIAVAERWFGNRPVCEPCGVDRNIPKDTE